MQVSHFVYILKRDGIRRSFYKFVRLLFTLYFQFLGNLQLSAKRRAMPDAVIKNINGFDMHLDLKNDEGISRDLYFHGAREPISVKYLSESGVIKPGDTVLDIGANIGYYAFLESKLAGPTGTVYALEPVRDTYKKLLNNIKRNEITNIETYNIAAGDSNKASKIHVGKKRNWSSMTGADPKRYSHTETVEMVRIDDFLKEKKTPTFVRMDVEGYEYAILQGMSETMCNAPRLAIHIEIHPDIMSKSQTMELFSSLEKSKLTQCIVLHEPYSGWLTPQYNIRPIIHWLTEKIGDTGKLGCAEKIPFNEVKKNSIITRKQLRILFTKGD